MKLGAIDIGSNSIHLLIVEFGADGQPHIIEKLRDQTQLAENMSSGRISRGAFTRWNAFELRRSREECRRR